MNIPESSNTLVAMNIVRIKTGVKDLLKLNSLIIFVYKNHLLNKKIWQTITK